MKTIASATLALLLLARPDAVDAQDRTKVDVGRDLYGSSCATCHGRGSGNPGTIALQAKYAGKSPALLEDRTDLTAGSVRFVVRRGVSIMPFFRKTEVSDTDLDAIVAYLTRPRAATSPAPTDNPR